VSNVVGYVRVSSATQAEEGLGLEVQEQAIRDWCDREGHELLAVHRDEGISGTKEVLDRPGLGAALAAVEDVAEALVVYRLDRLARDLILQETIISRLERAGKRTLSTAEDVDGNDPTRVLIRQVLGAISQYERGVITARMAAGRWAKHNKGGFAFGAPRFGQRAVDRELTPDETEQLTIARMVGLRNEGKSLRAIVETLNSERHLPKRGGRWHVETVRRVLARIDPAA
jgi:DNA invertase Pin-like site-specific DNA recombinase